MIPAAVAAPTFFQALKQVLGLWQKYKKSDSLVRYTQTTRVEPITMIDQRAQHLAYLPDVLQSLLTLFGAYYLQAASLQVNVGKINVGKFLNPLNPDRPFMESYQQSLEALRPQAPAAGRDFRFALPNANRPSVESLPMRLRASLEATVPQGWREAIETGSAVAGPEAHARAEHALNFVDNPTDKKPEEEKKKSTSFDIGTDLNKDIKEAANLAVGRLYTVEISDDGHKASIPVLVRLLTNMVPSALLVHILSDGSRVRSSSMKERWYAYKSGELKFWRDLVFCADLIDEHKKALLADDKGVYAAILARRAANKAAGVVSMEPSVGTASNLLVITRDTLREIEREIGGKFDRFEVRQKLFETTYLMIVAVIDPSFDHVTFYHRGIAQPSEMSVRDLKTAAKGGGPDVSELLKAFISGQAPAF